MDLSKVLIIIPTYNERENIVLIIPEIKKILPQVHILVVDDSSPDGTAQCVEQMARGIDGVHLFVRPTKDGLGKAYISGFKWALEREYEFIFEMDADFSHSPEYLPAFLEAARENDLVLGSRYICGVNVVNWPMSRLLLSYFANRFARFITGIPVKDCTGGFKCFRRSLLQSLKLDSIASSGYSFQIELNYFAWKGGFRLKEIPIVFSDRQRGVSKMSTKIIREALVLIWRLRISSFFKKKAVNGRS
ncbi:polyprenol monophosphomannose synthase [Chitinispirillales bacterium ANBcel5]|uniref:polyprenol monophosphomannose synthase n=1 Tax=Cellulosispirillum alkaliphilum TaxID=3039283 RepID=UPI002A539140|nr:polyprenol monophosphomannose synthase [Chitinispirillales bacterium ANBcel5]